METLYDKLAKYATGEVYPMHMPGHKRNADFSSGLPYNIDITEISGFDDLHEPRGVLRDTSRLAASIYGSDRAFMLINGSTVGILAAIGALAKRGEKVLVAKYSHRSVHNAITLFGLNPVYLKQETDETSGVACDIAATDVELSLQTNPDIKLVVVTSPTYEGVISDIHSIAATVHRRGLPLLVDSAHGAHLGFSPMFRHSAVGADADVVVMSLHKTLPALTQCSLLHVSGNLADADEIARMLCVLQTSSPSYVLMASIDRCLNLLASDSAALFSA
ncbi:MAG: aminotransferase class I/II-fold pyridoxal phosphate-dependent enzyme, partial [Oscillospiraceae bacterium]|nr:aminotransferase class I/II-fold pyridoxal phosphate-dependent enzyme [Oscillospiraceae bacterium]